MPIDEGRYVIQSGESFVGTEPVPPIWPPPPVPLRGVRKSMEDIFTLMRSGSGMYVLKVGNRGVVYKQDKVFLGQEGEKPVNWAVEPVGGGRFCIKLPDTDLCWTLLKDGDFPFIVLQPYIGAANQQWVFLRLYDD